MATAAPTPELGTSPSAIWRFVWPQTLMMYLMFFMGFITIWVAGRISAQVQAALGLSNQVCFFLMVVSMAISSGATACISQSLGALKVRRAQRYIATTVVGSLGLGVLMALAGIAFSGPILAMVLVPDDIMPITREIWQIFMLGLPGQYLYAATGVIFRSTRQVFPPLWVTAGLCLLTLFSSLGFGLGWFGLPDCGYMGLVWTNFAVNWLGAALNCLLLGRSGYLRGNALPCRRWLEKGLPYLLKVALPAGAASIVWQSGYLTLFILVASLPNDSVNALAGLTAGLRAEGLLIMPGMALNMAVAVLVGNCLGAGRPEQARRLALNITWIGSAVLSLLAIGLWPLRHELAALLSDDAGTQAQIFGYLTYNLASTPFSVASTIMGGIMVGAGATHYNLMVYGGSSWLVRLPLGWLLGHFLWGTSEGVFLSMLVSQCLQACAMLLVVRLCSWPSHAMRKAQSGKKPSRSS